MDRFFFDIEVEVSDDEYHAERLALLFDVRGAELQPGATLELPPVLLAEASDALALMQHYADEVAVEMEARVPDRVPSGWCSWYYFYNRVSEADVLANLEDMVRTGHPAEYVQIDDGFQSHTGDWLTPNESSRPGMKALADQIRTAGYKPGLWLAPFVLNEESAALRTHPDLALQHERRRNLFVQTWLGRCAVLDCTHPAAEAWLREVIRTVVREWGYLYLKLDALTFAARPADAVRYHAPGTTAAMNVRRGLEIIRDEAGDDTFILGCTCHFGPAVGLVDAMRVGPDVKALWSDGPNPSVKHAMRLTLQRNWMHNRWWANDPDCLIVRETDTALDEAEVRFLATGIALSGGMVVASDDLPKLSDARRDMALALFPPPGIAAEPVDASEAPTPSSMAHDARKRAIPRRRTELGRQASMGALGRTPAARRSRLRCLERPQAAHGRHLPAAPRRHAVAGHRPRANAPRRRRYRPPRLRWTLPTARQWPYPGAKRRHSPPDDRYRSPRSGGRGGTRARRNALVRLMRPDGMLCSTK